MPLPEAARRHATASSRRWLPHIQCEHHPGATSTLARSHAGRNGNRQAADKQVQKPDEAVRNVDGDTWKIDGALHNHGADVRKVDEVVRNPNGDVWKVDEEFRNPDGDVRKVDVDVPEVGGEKRNRD
jgi:hypothetical protein